MNVQHILKLAAFHQIALIWWIKEKYFLSVSLVFLMEVQINDVRPVVQVLVPVSENDDVELIAQVRDVVSRNVIGSNSM